MSSTIESTHNKIIEKIYISKKSLESMKQIIEEYKQINKPGKKFAEINNILDNLLVNLLLDEFESIETAYNLSIITTLNDYYLLTKREDKITREYYRIITSENFCGKLELLIQQAVNIITQLYRVCAFKIMGKQETHDAESRLDVISRELLRVQNTEISSLVEKRNYEVCKCGERMTVIPELSELVCTQTTCGKTKKMVGVVFRDDQFYPQEGQKTKHGGYDEGRHYRFWMERLQALETKVFTDEEKSSIEYVINRDGIIRKELNCEIMREILKDAAVSATHLNDHAPLLVKTFGGIPPPQLDFQENKIISMQFTKAMKLYDIVNPDGGNKPYYPYFIYKIIEKKFNNNYEKLRLLDFIHLQSRETVVKNDKYWEKMCDISEIIGTDKNLNPVREFVYQPTDPRGWS
jgi:hypothetical protein